MSGKESGQVAIPKNTHNSDDALRTAVKTNKLEDVITLMQRGANPLYCQWEKNDKFGSALTTLELAILRRNKPMVMAMLKKGECKEKNDGEAMEGACKVDTEKLKDIKGCIVKGRKKSHRHTLFAKLVENLPDVAAMVLDHCITKEGAPHEKDYKISFDCSLLENETSNANKCDRGIPCAYVCELIRQRCAGTITETSKLCNFENENYDAYEKHRHPLSKVMQSNDSGLLNHPVVQALLESKLKRFGWLLYYSNLLLYILLVSILTSFLLILPNPQDQRCVQLRECNENFSEAENFTSGLECSMELDSKLPTLLGLKIVALVLAFLRLILELYQLYSRKLVGYFDDWVNWFELAEYVSIIIFLFSVTREECFCPETWEWEVGVVSLALSWVVLIAWLQAMHWIGIYVTILLRIIVSFARVAIFGVFLVVGFGLTFYLLFYQPPEDESANAPSIFSSPLHAILSAISLTAGEFDTGGVFYSDDDETPSPGRQYESLAFIIWLAGVIIMSVLFNNLLVGLAVGEVSSVIDDARITTIKQRIELVLTQEEQFPEFIHRRLIQIESIVVQPNKRNKIQWTLLIFVVISFVFCSLFICCNNNHGRYWKVVAESLETRQSDKYKEVPGLIEKTELNSEAEVERGEESPVTKQDMQNLNEQVTVIDERVTAMDEHLTAMNGRLTVMQDLLLEIKSKI